MQQLIGRATEVKALLQYINSDKSEFIAVYGRRRVGKTFLIRKAFNDNFVFSVTGVYNAPKQEQLTNFAIAMQRHTRQERLIIPRNWLLAFFELSKYIETLPDGNKIIFIDEMPWMDTAKSGFIAAIENFWNSWASIRNDIKLIVCGSATSWMISNLISSKGGLHNRLTHHIVVKPFTLGECEDYFRTYKFQYSRKQIAECYMAMGGIPYYLSLMDRSKSVAQNIDTLFFAQNAPLRNEFNDLYKALFKNAMPHIAIVTALASKGIGLTRKELIAATGLADNGAFSTQIEELMLCGLIRAYEPFSKHNSNRRKERQKRETIFQLTDFYTLFYFNFIQNNRFHDDHFWTNSLNSPTHSTWSGLAFEMLCLDHLPQIKHALGITGVQANACSWRGKGSQIDLIIDRKDDTINICEMKYAKNKFEINKDYEARLESKINDFINETATKKALILTLITTHGIKPNAHSGIVQAEITLDALFHL